jgi:hypothetical protein
MLGSGESLLEHDTAVFVHADQVEYRLAKIDANYAYLHRWNPPAG